MVRNWIKVTEEVEVKADVPSKLTTLMCSNGQIPSTGGGYHQAPRSKENLQMHMKRLTCHKDQSISTPTH